MFSIFRKPEEKNLVKLLEEILLLNHDKPRICDLVNKGILKDRVNKVMKAYENDSEIHPQGDKIKQWSKEKIKNWADFVKGTEISRKPEFLEEMIAVLKRANILYSKNDPRTAQVLAILLFESANEKGRLLQVSTGEGKSTICAMLASIKVLQGEDVDIITSSPILAMRDAEERESFYEILGISCGSNEGEDNDCYSVNLVLDSPNGSMYEIKKNCYSKNIVYGDVRQFQFDWLSHEHKKMGTKGSRGFGVVIVDEVDNMMIDYSSRTARLTGGLAGFEHLNPVFCRVANELNGIRKRIRKIENKTIYIDGEFEEEGGNFILGDGATIYKIDNVYEFVSEHLTEFTTNLIKERTVELPKFLRNFCLMSVEDLVRSAIESWKIYQKRVDYLTVKGKDENSNIAPVDYESTGIVQEHETYSDGLHQFLQIKHGLKLTPESVPTSFISNLGYFKKYGAKIYSMAGTVGSEAEQDLLSSIYEIDFGLIPTYKEKQFKEIEGIVASNNYEWLLNVSNNIVQEVEKGRSVLVICETIENVKTINDILIKVYPKRNIRLYSRNDNDECSAVKEKVDSRDIIIATNLAGRGTDIKTSASVESNGGMHVIVTFLPSNTRVEQQAFGRTARQGAKGTAQLVINRIHAENKLNVHEVLNNIRWKGQLRDCKEYIRIQETKLYGMEEVELRDILFERYLEVDNNLRETEIKKMEGMTIFEKLGEEEIYKLKLLQVEEIWGMELKLFEKTLNYDIEAREKLQKTAKNFGFKPYGNNKKIFSLYSAISIYLENRASREHLLWLAVGHYLDGFTDAKDTIYIGLEARSEKHFGYYRPLKKVSGNNQVIKTYLSRAMEVEATDYKSDIGLFERKEIRKLLYEIIKKESEEIKKCNLVKREEGISYFTKLFNKIKVEYEAGNKVMRNPAYMVRIGIKKSKGEEKINILEGACNLEETYSLPAHYNLAYAVIEGQIGGYKQKAVINLSIAKERIDETLIPNLQFMQILLPLGQSSELSKQNINKIEILNTIKSNIEEIIKICNESSEKKLKVKKVDLEEYFNNKNLEAEIRELKNEGLQFLFDVNIEIDWFGVVFLGIAGAVQIGIGLIFASYGFKDFGEFFVSEGIGDLLSIFNLIYNKEDFNMRDYIHKKAINALVVSSSYGIKKLSENLPKYLGIPMKEIPDSSGPSDPFTIKSFLKDVGTKMLIKNTINSLLDTGADKLISQFREDVKENILKELKICLDDPNILTCINELAAIDFLFEEKELDEIIISTIKILEDKKSLLEELINNGLEELLKSKLLILKEIGIHATYSNLTMTISDINAIAKETAKEISEVFKSKIKGSYKQKIRHETILERKLKPKIDLKDARKIIMLLEERNIINGEEIDINKALEVDFGTYNDIKLEILEIFNIYNVVRKHKLGNKIKEDIIRMYEENITNYVLKKIKSRALGCLTNALADEITDHINKKLKDDWNIFKKERIRKLKNMQNIISMDEIKDSQKEKIIEKSKLDIIKTIKDNFKKKINK
ncbi:secA DEAD-like domain protein [Gigaspora margarita]|uniref:SecA DEAD-like domain protein n=1 Tax=Gigaspora margarita TaxID=4874 RepID=A0A8H4AMI4_GIGMA|nr:secA DEAD-like domain protein [Gigaspora margarita]